MEEKEKRPLQVVDKRHFTKEGEWRESPREPGAKESAKPPGGEAPEERPEPEASLPGSAIGTTAFTEFVLNLSSSALMSLGQIPNPMTQRPEVDLEAAASIIDVLDMLDEKTRGNLDGNERHVLQDMITQLHLLFAQVGRKRKP